MPQPVLVIGEEDQVIAVPHITRHPQLFLDEVIDRVQQDVGEELAGQIANWQPARMDSGDMLARLIAEVPEAMREGAEVATVLRESGELADLEARVARLAEAQMQQRRAAVD